MVDGRRQMAHGTYGKYNTKKGMKGVCAHETRNERFTLFCLAVHKLLNSLSYKLLKGRFEINIKTSFPEAQCTNTWASDSEESVPGFQQL